MKVAFDDQIFSAQPVGGISRYFAELLRAYRTDPSLDVQLASSPIWTQNVHLLDVGMGRRLPGRLGQHARVLRAVNRCRRSTRSADVIHHTFYDVHHLRRHSHPRLRVVTIYDMIPELFPERFPHGNPHEGKAAFVAAADLILCISEATRQDLIEVLGRPAAPIVVTPLGVDQRFRPHAPKPKGAPSHYVLYVGSRAGYKDFDVLSRAFAGADIPSSVVLLVIGGSQFTASELDSFVRLKIDQRVQRLDLDDTALAGAYAHALCFAFPSRHEGFGLPTLEAMASGCPTILSRSSAHPEVGGDAVRYFPAGDHEQLAAEITQMAADAQLRDRYRDAGLAQAATFSWSSTAHRTAAAYRRALGPR